MDLDARRQLVEERASQRDIDELKQQAEEFVADIADQADDLGWDPMLFLHVLNELETSEPAEYVFERIQQRLAHAAEREQEERHAARTRPGAASTWPRCACWRWKTTSGCRPGN
jgi:ATP-dependent RNA helicase SUPV3L1/SUV3